MIAAGTTRSLCFGSTIHPYIHPPFRLSLPFQCPSLPNRTQANGNNDQSIIFIGANSGALGSGLPTTIANLTFKNTGVIDGPRGTGNSTYRGIHIRGVGGSDASRGQIYNCEFLDFADSGIILGDVAIPPRYWDFHNNLFNGSRVAIYLNENGNCSIYDNTMRNFVVGVAMDANDAVSDVVISGNSFLGTFYARAWGPVSVACTEGRPSIPRVRSHACTRPPHAGGPYIPAPNNYYGVLMSDASLSATDSRNFVVRNNIVTGSTWGIYIYSTTSGARFHNLNGVEIRNNSIYDNTLLGASASSVPRDINSQSPANLTGAAHNWWGVNTGPSASSLYSPNGTSITYRPWIFSYTNDPAKAGSPGFWPINIVEWDGSTASPTVAPTVSPTAQGYTYPPTQAPTAAPVVAPTPVGTDVVVSFNESSSGQGGTIDFSKVDAPGVTVSKGCAVCSFVLLLTVPALHRPWSRSTPTLRTRTTCPLPTLRSGTLRPTSTSPPPRPSMASSPSALFIRPTPSRPGRFRGSSTSSAANGWTSPRRSTRRRV